MNINLSSPAKFVARLSPVTVSRKLIWFAIITIAVSGALVAFQLNYLRHQAIATGERSTQGFVRLVEEQTARTFQSIDQRLELSGDIIARSDAIGGMAPQAARQLLQKQLKGFPFLRAILVLDREGRIKYNSDEGHIGLNLADRDYFQIYRAQPQTALFFGKPVRSRTNGLWLITAARPLRSATGEVTGVIVASLEASYFEGLWRKTDLGNDSVVALWRRDGMLMMRSPPDNEAMGKNFTRIPLFTSALPSGPAGKFTSSDVTDEKFRIFAYRKLSDYPQLVSTVGQTVDVILKAWRDFATIVAIIWVLASGLIVALCFFLNRFWQQRLRAEQNSADLAERLTLATNAAAIGIWDWNVSTRHWYTTAICFRMLGEESADGVRIDEPWIEQVHPEDRDEVDSKMRPVLDGEESAYGYDARVKHADGTYRWIRVHGQLMQRDSAGKAGRILGVSMDITAAKEAELSLRASAAENRALISAIPDLIFTNDRDGTFVSVHASDATALLAPSEVFLGRKVHEILPAPVAERMMRAFEKALASGVVQTFEYSLVVAGASQEYEARVVPRDQTTLITIVREVTEKTRAKAELMDSEARFRTIVERGPVPMCVYRGTDIIFVNPAAMKLLGAKSKVDLLSSSILALVHPDSRPRVLARLKEVAAGNAELALNEFRFLKFDGTPIDIEVQGTPIVYSGLPAIHVSMRNVTAEREAETALRKSEAALAEAQRVAHLGSWSWDAAADLVEWSDELYKILGQDLSLPPPTYEGHLKLYPAESAAKLNTAVQNAMTTGAAYKLELERKSADGQPCWVDARGEVVRNANGQIVGLRGTLQNITKRKLAEAARVSLEAQLRESQKMEAIGTLAGGIAHDFNNILATILGNTELARQDLGSDSPALQSLDEIKKAGSRARDLVRQILSFSRREPTQRALTSLTPSIDAAVSLLRATLPARLTLKVHCDSDIPLVMADPTQIQQVIINLVTNAMQANRSGPGRIDIGLCAVTIDEALVTAYPSLDALQKSQQRIVQLSVSDDGPGMDAATQARVFEPFFTTKEVNEGTGLGLSVVHGIVAAHDGVIILETEVGKGARFSIFLPAAETNVAALPADEGLPLAAQGLPTDTGQHILYVDDDEALVFLVRRLLGRRGYHIHGHTDQREALAEVRADPARFDLVVTDYNMPGLSGLDVARAVRDIRADLPVVIASGFIDETLRAQSVGAGVRELIFKANAVEDMCDAFVRLIGKKKAQV